MWCHKQRSCLGLRPLDDFPKTFSENERNLWSGAKTKNSSLSHSDMTSGSEKEQRAHQIL